VAAVEADAHPLVAVKADARPLVEADADDDKCV
jgi:hypothetical protein